MNILRELAEAWVDSVTNMFGVFMDWAFRSNVASLPHNRLTDRTEDQRFGELGVRTGRYDPFRRTRRALYRQNAWRGGIMNYDASGRPQGLFG